MKFSLYLLVMSFFSVSLFARSIVPDRVITPALDIFNSKNFQTEDGDYQVQISTYNDQGRFFKHGDSLRISPQEYAKFKNQAMAVLQMIPNDSLLRSDEVYNRRGTAINIGNNLVLTNFHVLDPKMKKFNSCGDFELTNYRREKYRCKKVHYCNIKHDLCLIEMKPKIITKRDCFFCPGKKMDISLKNEPQLKLKRFTPVSSSSEDEVLTAIGNTQGLGIHLSQGTGYRLTSDRIYFYAPIAQGNSGGALVNNEGHVIGLVWAQSENYLGTDIYATFNLAAPSQLVIQLIQEALQSKPETLEKFNQSVVE